MNSLKNKVNLIGNLGRDVEIKETKNGKKLVRFSLATNDSYKDKEGNKIVDTQWHNAIAWGKTAEMMALLLKKGNEVAIEGRLTYGSFQNKDGVTKYTTDIVVSAFHKLTRTPLTV
ncbi:MAG: single-stranded DNA-binding protein [Bacteroidia bacterium]|nr:single-stranded DNA-binding protein [Bacteroidia bacterium]